ncbi:response regulator [Terriglobus sp. YAF25]|uniref:response regulator n=1 Tax=Terriglobus sp. YAF25 TaxID=3233080 RepID=UPI003F99C2A7
MMQMEHSDAPSLLVIDDDIELCGMLRSLLEMEQFAVTMRHDVASGLAEALSGRHRLVVLDIMLPGGDGRALLRDLRARAAPRHPQTSLLWAISRSKSPTGARCVMGLR